MLKPSVSDLRPAECQPLEFAQVFEVFKPGVGDLRHVEGTVSEG